MAYLILADKTVFEGKRIGAEKEMVGEIVFTTSVVGYLETLTDPRYSGQIVVQTFPLIGNYGVIPEDIENECFLNGYIVREICSSPSNFRSEGELDSFLKEKGVAGLCGIDTRELTRIIREKGTMKAKISDTLPEDYSEIISYKPEIIRKAEKQSFEVSGAEKRVAILDFGAKADIVKTLNTMKIDVDVYPYNTKAEEILDQKYDGIIVSGGAGNPEDCQNEIAEIKKLFGKAPLFGFGLGHQLIALSQGGKVKKLKYGHRGSNQPASEAFGNRTYMTSQNHSYTVVADSVNAKTLFVNANDGDIEGLEYAENCFTVQFDPTLSAGKNDSLLIYDKFIKMMGGKENA